MRSLRLQDTTFAILAGLVAAAALAQPGCLGTQPGNADETAPGAPAPAGQRSRARESSDPNELKQPLLREFGKALNDAGDLEDSERNEGVCGRSQHAGRNVRWRDAADCRCQALGYRWSRGDQR